MHQVDALADAFGEVSPFSFGLNNPVMNIDPSGDSTVPSPASQVTMGSPNAGQRGVQSDAGKVPAGRMGIDNSRDAATLSAYKPDMADRWREGNIGQQMAYGAIDGLYSLFANNHLGGRGFESYNDKIDTRMGGLLSLASPLLSKGTAAIRLAGTAVREVALAAKGGKELFKFGGSAAKHMAESGRYVPIQILEQAIKGSKGALDPKGSRALMHSTEMWRNGKPYQLDVLYDRATNAIWHFQYGPIKP